MLIPIRALPELTDQFHYFDPKSAVESAQVQAVADRQPVTTSSGLPPRVLTLSEFFSQPMGNHPHPQGYPCRVDCRFDANVKV